MDDYLLIIESGTGTASQKKFIETALDNGYNVAVLSKIYLDFQAKNFILIQADPFQLNDAIESIRKTIQHNKINFIQLYTVSELCIIPASIISEKMGIPYIPFKDALCVRNKFEMRKRLEESGVPVPKYKLISNDDEALDFIDIIGFPAIIKPLNAFGSELVLKVTDTKELISAIQTFKSNFKEYNKINIENLHLDINENEYSGKFLIEEFMEGPEYSIESIFSEYQFFLLGITEKEKTNAPYFIETGHLHPVKTEYNDKIEKIVKQAVEALHLNFGICHSEVIVTKTGPKIVEIAFRPGGDNITQLINLAHHTDIFKLILDSILGKKIELSDQDKNFALIRYFLSENGKGRINKLAITKPIFEYKELKEFKFSKTIGDIVKGPPLEFNDIRLGYFILSGPDQETLKKVKASILESVKFHFQTIP